MRGMSVKVVKLMLVAAMMLLPAQGFAVVGSAQIAPADGTTGQSLSTGSGIKTGHIQDGAVTTSKIASGAVTDENISGTISGIKLGSHTHNGSDIVDGSITSLKLAIGSVGTTNIIDGAVTSSKLSGLIGVDKLDVYSEVYIVHKGAANNQTTFNSIKAAIERIGVPWSGERKTILVMPGTYQEDLSLLVSTGGPSSATLPFNVDIIGASRSGSIIVPTNENGILTQLSQLMVSI